MSFVVDALCSRRREADHYRFFSIPSIPPGPEIFPHSDGVVAAPGPIGPKVRPTQVLVARPKASKQEVLGHAHFETLAEQSPVPIVVYNVPSRTVADISVETLARVAKHPRIVGIKDATGNLARVTAQRLACGKQFVQLSGNDDMALGFNAMGGVGCISVTANVAPKLCSEFQQATREGRWEDALQLQDRLYPLHAALFSDASPGPAKYALTRVRSGFPAGLRLPLVEPSDGSKRAVDAALEHAGLV